MTRDALAVTVSGVAVVAVVLVSFTALGGPGSQRMDRSDQRIIRSMYGLATEINQTWLNSSKSLPSDLEKLPNYEKLNPITKKPFTYRPKSLTDFELCATFATDNREAQHPEPNAAWTHPKGDFCFPFDAGKTVPMAPYDY